MRNPRGGGASIVGLLQYWTKRFQSNNIPDAKSSAQYIIAHTLGKKTLFGVEMESYLTKQQREHVNQLCQLRLSRYPVQYLLGEWDFLGLTLKLKPPVLIPRPETEELASLCSDCVGKMFNTEKEVFLEIGSGTGAISLALLKKYNNVHAVAIDISEQACDLTRLNGILTGVADRLTVLQGDINDNKMAEHLHLLGPYKLVVSNPPYISTADMIDLQPEVKLFEDHRALCGGKDGMELTRTIILRAAALLHDNGHLWLEVGEGQSTHIERFTSDNITWAGCAKKLRYLETVKDFYRNQGSKGSLNQNSVPTGNQGTDFVI